MKMKKLLMIILAGAFLTACGGGGAGIGTTSTDSSLGKLAIQFKTVNSKVDVKKDFEPKKGGINAYLLNVDSKPIVQYVIDLTDFESDVNPTKKPNDEKQTLITISLFGDSGATAETPLRTGTFELYPSFATVDQKYSKISNVATTTFKDGKTEEYSFITKANGTIKINSVSGDAVSGEVDLSQENGGSIKGNFTARMKK